MFLRKLYSLIPVAQTILYHPLNHQLRPVVFLPAGTLPPGLVTDILGYLQNEIVQFLHCWMHLIVSLPTTPTLTESLVFWCVLPLLSPPLHHSYLSFPVDGSVFNSPESTPKSPCILSVSLCKAMASLLFHHNWPLGSLLEGLGRGYLRIEGEYSSRSCTH